MRIRIESIKGKNAGRFVFMKLLSQSLIEQGDWLVHDNKYDVCITHGFDLTKEKIKGMRNIIVRQDGWAPRVYDKMIKENFLSEWMDILSKVDRVIYQSEFCMRMFDCFDHDTSNGIVIHNGVRISEESNEKRPIFVIYTKKDIEQWYKKLVGQTTQYIQEWCEENKLDCVIVKKNSSTQLGHHALLDLFRDSKYMMHLYPFAPCSNTLLESIAEGNVALAFNSGGDAELTLKELLIPLTPSNFDFPKRDIEVSRDTVHTVLNRARDNYSSYQSLLGEKIKGFDYNIIGKKYRDVCLELIGGL